MEQYEGMARLSKRRNVLDNELIFWSLNINGNHWVLIVLFKPKLVLLMKNKDHSSSRILYLDPLNKNLSDKQTVVTEGIRERKKPHIDLLLWLNFELGNETSNVYNNYLTFPILYDFGEHNK